jgi:tripartite-type tricarboxylate transporter receptor subunit TctC
MDELGRSDDRASALRGFDSTAWYGLLGPAGLPREAVQRLTQALAQAGADKDLVARINATGCDTEILAPAQTVEKIKADHAKWGRVVKEANIKAE